MKFTCELDWVEEDETIDSKIQDLVIEKVVEVVSKGIGKELFEKIEKEAREKISKEIDARSLELISKFLDREVVATDQWGDVLKKYPSVTDLLKAKFDAFLSATVDKNGQESRSNYYGDAAYTRIHYLLDKRIADQTKTMTDAIASEVGKKFEAIKAQVHHEAVEKITKKLGL